MTSAIKSGKSGSRGEPEKTRAAILKAALEEFSHEGVTGARTDEIARRAGVNKALLYYYFKDKEGLYAAALDQVFSGLHERTDLFACSVALLIDPVGLIYHSTPLGVKLDKFIQRICGKITVPQRATHCIQILPHIVKVQHNTNLFLHPI